MESTQYTPQFLNRALSQVGPSGLPYAETIKWHIGQHLLQLVEAYPSLQPKTADFTHNDGRTVSLLQADGTVPMDFQGVTYNIPVIIWLMESYPHYAPLVFVNPTRDMIIKRPHPFVSPNGAVSIPYLQSWVYPSSNLAELARNLRAFFSRDPPLYSQRKPPNSPSPTNPSSDFSSSYGRLGSYATRPASIPGSVYPPSPSPVPPYGGGGRLMDDLSDVFKKSAIDKLVENLSGDIRELRRSREAEMEGLFNVQAELRRRDEELRIGLREMNGEREALEQNLQMVLMNSDVLDSWPKDNKAEESNSVVVVDEAFEPCDVLSKQMLETTALNMAADDAVYALDKALQEGAVPSDQYLRNVRLLSREQFFNRATASKARAVQMQAQVASMASRVSQQYVS